MGPLTQSYVHVPKLPSFLSALSVHLFAIVTWRGITEFAGTLPYAAPTLISSRASSSNPSPFTILKGLMSLQQKLKHFSVIICFTFAGMGFDTVTNDVIVG